PHETPRPLAEGASSKPNGNRRQWEDAQNNACRVCRAHQADTSDKCHGERGTHAERRPAIAALHPGRERALA
ncbi:hypothetical protein R0K19_27730, partial [Bacillus sp. SIMBA_161]